MFKKFLAFFAAMYMAVSFAAVDVNKATVAELDSIKGIGPSISSKIVDERKKGAFKDWNDFVQRVKGIGPGNAAKFSAAGMTVDGADFKGAPAASTTKGTAKKDAKSVAKTDEKKTDSKSAPATTATAVPSTSTPKADAPKPAASAVKK